MNKTREIGSPQLPYPKKFLERKFRGTWSWAAGALGLAGLRKSRALCRARSWPLGFLSCFPRRKSRTGQPKHLVFDQLKGHPAGKTSWKAAGSKCKQTTDWSFWPSSQDSSWSQFGPKSCHIYKPQLTLDGPMELLPQLPPLGWYFVLEGHLCTQWPNSECFRLEVKNWPWLKFTRGSGSDTYLMSAFKYWLITL